MIGIGEERIKYTLIIIAWISEENRHNFHILSFL